MLLLLLLLINPVQDGTYYYDNTIFTAHPAIIVNESINIIINNSIIYSKEFMTINCQEDVEVGLINCSNVHVNVTVTNSVVYSEFIIYSDQVRTQNIHINNNWYHAYNGFDPWFVWEKNHDIIDYNPKTKPLNKHKAQLSS